MRVDSSVTLPGTPAAAILAATVGPSACRRSCNTSADDHEKAFDPDVGRSLAGGPLQAHQMSPLCTSMSAHSQQRVWGPQSGYTWGLKACRLLPMTNRTATSNVRLPAGATPVTLADM